MTSKVCTRCGGSGPFGRRKSAKDGLKSHCRTCCAVGQAAYRARNPDVWSTWAAKNATRLKARDAARYAVNSHAEKVRVGAYKTKNPDKVAIWQSRSNLRRYGFTLEDRDALLAIQGGVCAICGIPLTTGRTGMQVDHDHATGCVRGLLCHSCNIMVGNFKDDPELLRAGANYLGRLLTKPVCRRPQEATKTGTRASNLWYSYGLTEEGVRRMLNEQGHACAICLSPICIESVQVDHDHSVRERHVRGLLCRSCNVGIGHARDQRTVLTRAVEYLSRFKGHSQ